VQRYEKFLNLSTLVEKYNIFFGGQGDIAGVLFRSYRSFV
jgi:hypothetical protein